MSSKQELADETAPCEEGALAHEKAVATSATPPKPSLPPHLAAHPPPDGGLQAWLHVVGGFMLLFNSWGILNTFGVFQTYYESGALFERSSSDIAWIGSLQSFILLLMGVVVGPIYDRGYLRTLLTLGGFLVVFGHMMLSICHEYWQVLLAQGFCIGIGAGCLFVPCISLLPTYFSSRLGLALGISYSGSSLGGVIYPIILYNLLDKVGFAWSIRIIGFISLATLMIPIVVMRMRFKMPKPRDFIDQTAFIDSPYMSFVFAMVLGMIGSVIVLFYISYFAVDKGFTDTRIGFYLVPILNVGSCLGRVLPNLLADKFGPFNMMAPCAIITGVLALCTMAVHNEAGIIVMALLQGFFSGVFIALPPMCFIPLIKDKTKIGTRIGMGYGIISVSVLAGGPGGGGIIDKEFPLNWNALWTYGGVTFLASGLIMFGLRFYRSGSKLMVKV